MPSPSHRSRTLRRATKRLPGGRTTIHYTAKKAAPAQCASCRTILKGVSISTTKTKKRPQRPYGGILCFACLRKKMKEKAQLFA